MDNDERRSLLKTCLKNSRQIQMLRNTLEIEIEARKSQFVEVDRAIPCILYANNRTAEKLLSQILKVGWDLCENKHERDGFIENVEFTINTLIFGKMDSMN